MHSVKVMVGKQRSDDKCKAIMPLQDVPDAAAGDQRQAFGWQLQSVQALKGARPLPSMTRIHRSLFSMSGMPTCQHRDRESSDGDNKIASKSAAPNDRL